MTEVVQNVARQTMMDRRGEGVPIILEDGERLSGRRPVYSLIDDSELKLTLYSAPRDSPADLSKIAQRLTENESSLNQRLKMLMRENPAITQHQLAGVCAVSRSAVAMSIKSMKESGEVSRQGSDRKGTWIVHK